MAKDLYTNIKFLPEIYQRTKILAAVKGVKLWRVVHEALLEYLDKHTEERKRL